MELSERWLAPCPECGGMTVLVRVPRHGALVWCTECERSWGDGTDFADEAALVDWWNHGKEA